MFDIYVCCYSLLTQFFGCCPTDVDDIKFVINFDYPNCSEDYVHRIGRTARSNKSGTAYTFFTTGNMKQANDLIGVLKEANQAINPQLYDIADMSRGGGGRMRSRNHRGVGGGRNDVRGGRDEPRGGVRSRDNYGSRHGDDRGRTSSRHDRNTEGSRGGYNNHQENQNTSNFGRHDGAASASGFNRENQGSYNNRDNQQPGFNRENTGYNRENNNNNNNNNNSFNRDNRDSSSAYNRESQGFNQGGRSGLLSTPQAAAPPFQQEDKRHAGNAENSHYNTRSQSSSGPPGSNQRSERNAPHQLQGPPPMNMNGQYGNGPSRGGHNAGSNQDRHGSRGGQQLNGSVHGGGPPPQRYENHSMQMNAPNRGGPPMNTLRPQQGGQNMQMNGSSQPMTSAQMKALFQQPPPPPPPLPGGGKGSLMGAPPQSQSQHRGGGYY